MDPKGHQIEVIAASKVFLDHIDFIRKVICFYIPDEQQADDMFQNCFVSFISHPLPGDIQNIKSYLYKAIVNDIKDNLRQKDHDKKSLYDYCRLTTRECNQETPDEVVIMMEEIGRIFHLIEILLPKIEAQAVYLQYQDNLNAIQIAEKMNVCPATVRGYVSKGIFKMRAYSARTHL